MSGCGPGVYDAREDAPYSVKPVRLWLRPCTPLSQLMSCSQCVFRVTRTQFHFYTINERNAAFPKMTLVDVLSQELFLVDISAWIICWLPRFLALARPWQTRCRRGHSFPR